MNLTEVLKHFQKDKSISDEFIESIDYNRELRLELIVYFRQNKDREFVILLLDKMISFRIQEDKEMSGDSIMLGCYLLGLHNNIEDSLRIWDAKTTDFDTFSYLDIQLVPFAGLDETFNYLKKVNTDNAKRALKYLLECKESGDFDNLDSYYAKDTLPWYV